MGGVPPESEKLLGGKICGWVNTVVVNNKTVRRVFGGVWKHLCVCVKRCRGAGKHCVLDGTNSGLTPIGRLYCGGTIIR